MVGGFMEIKRFEKLLRFAWTKETCVPSLREDWDEDNKSLGQCAITALLVNDYYGGKIMRCMTSTGSHYYNMIDDKIVDLTAEQFFEEVPMYQEGSERTREYLLGNEDTKARYLLLLKNYKGVLANKIILDSLDVEEIIEDFTKRREKKENMWRYDEHE